MAKMTGQEFAQKWSQRTTAAQPDYRRGIEGVTEAPGVKAAQAAERMVAGVQAAVQEGKWQERVQVPLGEWKQKAIEKGAPRIAAGVAAAAPNMARFGQELMSFQDGLKAQVDSSNPRGDLEANIQRSAAWQRGMATFRKS